MKASVTGLLLFVFMPFLCRFASSQTVIVLQPGPEKGKDARVWSLAQGSNYGDYGFIKANAWTWSSTFGIERSYLAFDLDTIDESLPILDARLSLYYHSLPGNPEQTHSGDNSLLIQRVVSPWEEHSVCWNTQPAVTTENALIVPPGASPNADYLDLDVTAMVQDMVDNPESGFGFLIRLLTETEYRRVGLSSSDHPVPEKWPKLVITLDCDIPIAGYDHVLNNLCVFFTDTSVYATNWLWDFGDGAFSYLRDPVHCYPEPGIYSVCLIASNSCGSDTVCKEIRLLLTSSAELGSAKEVTVYHETAGGTVIINIAGLQSDLFAFSIIDLSGRKVFADEVKMPPNGSIVRINCGALQSGVYFLLPAATSGLIPVKFLVR